MVLMFSSILSSSSSPLVPLVTHLCMVVVAVVFKKNKITRRKKHKNDDNDEDCRSIDVETNVKSIFFFCSSQTNARKRRDFSPFLSLSLSLLDRESRRKKGGYHPMEINSCYTHTQMPHNQIRSVYGFVLHTLDFFDYKGNFLFINSSIK